MENGNEMGSNLPKSTMRIKIISMGNTEVGKSCIIKRYCEKRFIDKYMATIGIDFGVTKFDMSKKDVKVNIFDMAGHPIFYEVRNEFYVDTQGALLVYDVTNRVSFESLDFWLLEMKNELGNCSEADNVIVCVCANKVDKSYRAVDELEGRLWADVKGYHYFETSAATSQGIQAVFKTLFEEVVNAAENGGHRKRISTQLGFSKDQVDAIHMLKSAKNDNDRLGVHAGASREEINRAYRRLAVLLHPDKSVAPGSEEAFKLLVTARTALLNKATK